jgi:hypothetical protein
VYALSFYAKLSGCTTAIEEFIPDANYVDAFDFSMPRLRGEVTTGGAVVTGDWIFRVSNTPESLRMVFQTSDAGASITEGYIFVTKLSSATT